MQVGAARLAHHARDAVHDVPDGVYSPGVGVFSECTQLRTAKLPKSANFFTDYFSGCTKLEKIDIPNGVQAIGSDAFRACLALREVTLPETLEDARSLAASSAFIAEHLPKTIMQQYTH